MGRALISVAEARAEVLRNAHPLSSEMIRVERALGRVLAEEVLAAGPVPPFPASAMDGYALNTTSAAQILRIAGESRAGRPAQGSLAPGTAMRISTGAVVPDGADAVLRQEDARLLADDRIELSVQPEPGANLRAAGEDMPAGRRLLRPGACLGPGELGAVVGAGVGTVEVLRRPIVAVLCTGDELRAPGEPLRPGQIHNSNGPMLAALATTAGAIAPDAQRIADDPGATTQALGEALDGAEVVIVSGGVSVGPHDHVKPVLVDLGVEEIFWRVALQPGKPLWFGRRGSTLVFGLPGNPVSAVVTFALFVRGALHRLGGRAATIQSPPTASLAAPVMRSPDRGQALRVRLNDGPGGPIATPTGPQGSHIVTSMLGAHALAMIPSGSGELPAGAEVSLESLWG